MTSRKSKPTEWLVVYLVKFSEEWCADECSWIEESAVITAPTRRAAQLAFRQAAADRERYIIGRHVSTYRVRR